MSIAGIISGEGGFTKSGLCTLTLTGTNTFTGNTTIASGTLTMNTNLITSSPTIIIGNGATLSASPAANASFTLAANQSIQGTGTT